MATYTNSIKVGRISSNVERGLKITLVSNPSVYLNEEFLNLLARKRPNSYPNDIEEISKLIKKPNFVFYLKENKEVVYAKTYILDHIPYFLLLYVNRQGKPKKWCAKTLSFTPLFNCTYLLDNYDCIRVS